MRAAKPTRRPGRNGRSTGKPDSLRTLAGRLGVSHNAVAKAVKSGRLSRSIGLQGGRPVVKDAALAEVEWNASAAQVNRGAPAPTLTQAQLRVAVQREQALALANEAKRGTLIDAEAARREAFSCARTVRDALGNIPDRLAAELAAESDASRVHARLEAELRLALEGLAEVLAHGNGNGH